jgi:hypothetical protein
MDKMPIMIISPSFELLGEIRNYESLQFTRRFYTVGEFELHINVNKPNTGALVNGNLIMLGNQGNKAGIIRHRENEIDENGDATDTLIIKGPTLKGVCAQRLVVPDTSGDGYDSSTGAQETIIKHFVTAHLVSPADASRKISQVAIAADQQRGAQDKWRFRFDVLSDALDTVGEYSKLGWDITLDLANQEWVFDVIPGRNLTASQSVLPPVIFNAEWGNIKTPHLIQSWINAATQGYCGGQGDGVDRLIQQVGSTSGLDRMEQFFDCSEAESAAELLSTGAQKLAEAAPTNTFEFGIDPLRPFIYGVDYDLGDTVTAISKKWGVTMDTQITEVKEVYEADGNSIEPTFGTSTPSLISYIKQQVKRTVR